MSKFLTTKPYRKGKTSVSVSLFTVLMFCMTSNIAAQADSYSEGMQAFMSGNYELAKIMWLKGAKNNDAKSMFNLGFLHEQKLLQTSNFSKAEEWYRLAGKNGYPAADYHLAQLLSQRQGESQQSKTLLQRSASSGYSPAQAKVAAQPSVPSGSAAVVNVPTASTSVPAAAEASGYLDKRWINSQRSGNWTIQLLAFENLNKVQQFIDQHGLRNNAAFFTENTDRGTLYKLVYGSFENKRLADLARQQMSAALQANGPWLRSMRSVQKIISGS